MVLHPYHHLVLHSQLGSFPHCGEDGLAHRERRGLGQTDRDSLRDTGLRLYEGVLQGMDSIYSITLFYLITLEVSGFYYV